MTQLTPPGAFPTMNTSKSLAVTKRKDQHKQEKMNDSHPRFKAQLMMTKFKSYFHQKEKVVTAHTESSTQKSFRIKKGKANEIVMHQQTNTVGSLLTMSMPITISNTTHVYGNNSNTKTPIATSIVQQLILLPPLQVYGFMLLVALLLLDFAFAILQIHRTLSIFQLAVDGIKYVLVGFTSKSVSAFSFFKSWF